MWPADWSRVLLSVVKSRLEQRNQSMLWCVCLCRPVTTHTYTKWFILKAVCSICRVYEQSVLVWPQVVCLREKQALCCVFNVLLEHCHVVCFSLMCFTVDSQTNDFDDSGFVQKPPLYFEVWWISCAMLLFWSTVSCWQQLDMKRSDWNRNHVGSGTLTAAEPDSFKFTTLILWSSAVSVPGLKSQSWICSTHRDLDHEAGPCSLHQEQKTCLCTQSTCIAQSWPPQSTRTLTDLHRWWDVHRVDM